MVDTRIRVARAVAAGAGAFLVGVGLASAAPRGHLEIRIGARLQGRVRAPREIRWVVLHSTGPPLTAASERAGAPEIGRWFAGSEAEGSAHLVVDNAGRVVRCVDDLRVAYGAAGGSANAAGLHLELVGSADWSRPDWLARGVLLDVAAAIVRRWCAQYVIPMQLVDAAQLRAGEAGITTHADVSRAFLGGAGHYDPGAGFPLDVFIGRVVA